MKPITFLGTSRKPSANFPTVLAFRIIYLATLPDRVLVLHAFQKKTQQTVQKDIELAAARLKDWMNR